MNLQLLLLTICYQKHLLQNCWMWEKVNPFPRIDAFWRLYSRRLFENIVTKEEIAQYKQFLSRNVSSFSHRLSIQLYTFSIFLTKYVQSRLLQNCCMRERVNQQEVLLQQTTVKIAHIHNNQYYRLPQFSIVFNNWTEICEKNNLNKMITHMDKHMPGQA